MKTLLVVLSVVAFASAKKNYVACKNNEEYPIPHSTDCRGYYECENGEEKLNFCPGQFHFNPKSKICDFPENAKCQLVTSTTEGSTYVPVTSTTEEPTLSTTYLPVTTTEAPIISTTEQESTIFTTQATQVPITSTTEELSTTQVPVTSTTWNYTETTEHIPESTTVNNNETTTITSENSTISTTWNYTETTEHIPESTTVNNNETTTITSDNSTSTTDISPDYNSTTTEAGTTIEVTTPDFTTTTLHPGIVCGEGIDLFPHPSDTNKYYVCINGTAHEKSCPVGQDFHPIDLKCVRPEEICKPGVQYIPHPFDCTLFYECEFQKPNVITCPDGLHFNPNYFVCDYPEDANCQVGKDSDEQSSEEPTCEGSEDGWWTHPSDCSKYYECKNETLYNYSCPTGLHFNQETGVCDWPENVNCPSEKSSMLDDIFSSIENKSDCNDGEAKFLPHEKDCTRFYRCFDYVKYNFKCPAGLHWNQAALTCQLPAFAGCA